MPSSAVGNNRVYQDQDHENEVDDVAFLTGPVEQRGLNTLDTFFSFFTSKQINFIHLF